LSKAPAAGFIEAVAAFQAPAERAESGAQKATKARGMILSPEPLDPLI
jgi:hypothetical protein